LAQFIKNKEEKMDNQIFYHQSDIFNLFLKNNSAVIIVYFDNYYQTYCGQKKLGVLDKNNCILSHFELFYQTANLANPKKVKIFVKSERNWYAEFIDYFGNKDIIIWQEIVFYRSLEEIVRSLKPTEAVIVANGCGYYRLLCEPLDLSKQNISYLQSTFFLRKWFDNEVQIVSGEKIKIKEFGGKLLLVK
jgi:hypothetical protein